MSQLLAKCEQTLAIGQPAFGARGLGKTTTTKTTTAF